MNQSKRRTDGSVPVSEKKKKDLFAENFIFLPEVSLVCMSKKIGLQK